MKVTEEELSNSFRILFKFDTTLDQETNQVEFLYAYYVSKLKLLRKNNYEPYTTKELSDAEIFYKDMISATACYIQSLKLKKIENERRIKESTKLS
jgi:hypothetical protein